MPRFWEGRGPGGTLFSPSQHASRTTAQGQNLSPQVARQSPTMFVLIMNGSHIEIDAHRLNDGGLLLSCSGNSYTIGAAICRHCPHDPRPRSCSGVNPRVIPAASLSLHEPGCSCAMVLASSITACPPGRGPS